jgi:hypothetical protein
MNKRVMEKEPDMKTAIKTYPYDFLSEWRSKYAPQG